MFYHQKYFFNDVSANNLIDSFTFVECKKLEIWIAKNKIYKLDIWVGHSLSIFQE